VVIIADGAPAWTLEQAMLTSVHDGPRPYMTCVNVIEVTAVNDSGPG
jgi:hypothetical protein